MFSTSAVVMPLLQGYNYPIEDLQPMIELLKEWNLECIYQTLLDELIDLKIMAIMKTEHVDELLKSYPLGIKILFSNNLEKWQKLRIISSSATTSLPLVNKKTFQEKLSASIDLNLEDILCASSTGLMIMEYYKTNHKFNDNIRSLLVDTIISYIITMETSMSVGLANYLADQVVGIFPTEVKDTYFLKYDANKNPKGKLYAKYYNAMRTLKTSGLISSTTHAKPHTTNPLNRNSGLHFEPENDVQNIVEQIKHENICSFPELENNWKATTKFRLNSIQTSTSTENTISNWSSYKLPLGYRLVDIDFNTMYPNSPNLMCAFEETSDKLINLLDEKIKDTSSRRLFDSLKEATDIKPNGKNTIIFYLLHAIFIPTSKKVTRDHTGKKNQTKYSIKDSQSSFIMFKNSESEIEEYINIRHYEKSPIQPLIMIVGTPINPKEIYVFFDSIKYKVFSVLHAVDVTFKLFHVFNLEYPSESVLVWLFIQKYFFSINTEFDVPCHTLGQILSDLINK